MYVYTLCIYIIHIHIYIYISYMFYLYIYIYIVLASVTYRWMYRYRDHYMPMHRTGSTSSIGQSSSNSSGLVPDCDPRHDLADRLYKLSVNTDINFRWKQCRQIGAGAFGTVRSILAIHFILEFVLFGFVEPLCSQYYVSLHPEKVRENNKVY